MAKKIDDIIIFIWTYIVIALPPLAILYLIRLFFPEADFFSYSNIITLDFPTLVVVSIVLPAIGAGLSILRKKTKFLFFLHLDKQAKFHTATVSLLLSVVLWKLYFVFSSLGYLGLIILFLFFLLYLPLSTSYLNSIDFNKLKSFIFPSINLSKIRLVERILYILTVLLLIHTLVVASDGQIRALNHHLILLSRYPQIKNVKPKIVYYGSKVILLGRGFGWGGEINTKFKNREGNIDITLWNDTKVIFTVPLHWREGDLDIWIQKPIEWDGKKMVIKSNLVKLRLISRDDGWGKDDDEYFEQLKQLDKETLELNGYK
ncbi:hypothetical protein HZA75_00700 [Candidatus Roizmanbacteria bacterium]|nr:hypothetical protein [Candidatus Roizmanbacteria bacterium]